MKSKHTDDEIQKMQELEAAQIDNEEDCPELYSKDTVDKAVYDALREIEKKEEEKEPEVVIGEL